MSTSSSRTEEGGEVPVPAAAEPAREPTHPGELLAEVIGEGLGLSLSEAARRLGVSRQTLHRVLRGEHGVSAEMALRLGRLCGNGPGLWLAMQQAFDLRRAEARLGDALARIPAPPGKAA